MTPNSPFILSLPYGQHTTGYPGMFKRCFLGTDVNSKKLHTVILAYPADNPQLYTLTGGQDKPVLVFAGSVPEFEDVKKLFFKYDCMRGVIDTLPDYHSTMKIAKEMPGRVYGCLYPSGWINSGATIWKYDDEKFQVIVSRSDSLSNTLSYVFENHIVFPSNVDQIGGYIDDAGFGEFPKHLMALTRQIDENGKTVYVHSGDDHFGHALNYAMIAAKASPLDTTDVINRANLMDAIYHVSTSDEKSAPVLPGLVAIKRSSHRSGLYGGFKNSKNERRPSGY